MIILIGLVGLVIFTLLVVSKKKFIKRSKKVDGTITEVQMSIQESMDEDGYTTKTKMYTPKIVFTTLSGENVEFLASTSTSSKRKYKVGNSIELLYDPAEPNKAVINKFFQIWILPIIVLIISIVFIVAGIFTL